SALALPGSSACPAGPSFAAISELDSPACSLEAGSAVDSVLDSAVDSAVDSVLDSAAELVSGVDWSPCWRVSPSTATTGGFAGFVLLAAEARLAPPTASAVTAVSPAISFVIFVRMSILPSGCWSNMQPRRYEGRIG